VPIEAAASISVQAAKVLYGRGAKSLWKFGRERAILNVSGVYKILFNALDINTVFSKAANFWPTQHDKGKAYIQKGGAKNNAAFCVESYPLLNGEYKQLIDGYICGVLESAGVQNVLVMLDESDPSLWKWDATWE
jgi:hypothetical protein